MRHFTSWVTLSPCPGNVILHSYPQVNYSMSVLKPTKEWKLFSFNLILSEIISSYILSPFTPRGDWQYFSIQFSGLISVWVRNLIKLSCCIKKHLKKVQPWLVGMLMQSSSFKVCPYLLVYSKCWKMLHNDICYYTIVLYLLPRSLH